MNKEKAIQSVNEIKELMEKSSKFMSLSGLTSILAGLYSLIGSYFAVKIIGTRQSGSAYPLEILNVNSPTRLEIIVLLALGVLVLSCLTAFLISYYKSKKAGQKLFNTLTYRILWNFSLPLITGGLFCVALLYHHNYGLTSSVMLLFYGLSLINASKYTFSNVAWLGYAFLILGIADSFIEGYALLFWTLGFGICHILYGILFYLEYERKK